MINKSRSFSKTLKLTGSSKGINLSIKEYPGNQVIKKIKFRPSFQQSTIHNFFIQSKTSKLKR